MFKEEKVKKTRVFSIFVFSLLAAFLFFVGCQSGGGTPATTTAAAKKAPPATATAKAGTATPTAEAPATALAPTESPTPTEEESASIIGKMTRRTNRDPFIPVVSNPDAVKVVVKETRKPGGKPTKIVPEKPQDKEIDPQIQVTGITAMSHGYMAILKSNSGKSYMVSQGQKVGDWNVSSVTKTQVILKAPGYIARLNLKEASSEGKTGKAGGKKGEIPGMDEGPKIKGK